MAENQEKGPQGWKGIIKDALKSGALKAKDIAGGIAGKADRFLMEKSFETGLPLHPLGATTAEKDSELNNVRGNIRDKAQAISAEIDEAMRIEDEAKAREALGRLEKLASDNPPLSRFFQMREAEVAGRELPGEPTTIPSEQETERVKSFEKPILIGEPGKLTVSQTQNFLMELELNIYGARGLDTNAESSLSRPVRIAGEAAEFNKQKVIEQCLEVLTKSNDPNTKEFLKDFHMARAIHRFYNGAHQAVKDSVDGAILMTTINQRQEQGEFPPSDPDHPDAPGHYSRWVYFFLEKNHPKRQQYFNIYHAQDLDFTTISHVAKGNPDSGIKPDLGKATAMLNQYFDGLAEQEIFIDDDVRQDVINLFTSQDLDQRVKLDRIIRLREIWFIPYATHRRDPKTGKRLPDIYPTERPSLNLDLEDRTLDIKPAEGKGANTHLATRIRGIKGYLTGIEDYLWHGHDLYSWYYHNNRYAVVTRILCLTALGMHVYDRYFDKFEDFQGRAGIGSDLNFDILTEYAQVPLRGDWFGFLEPSKQSYKPEDLRARGFCEQRVRELQHVIGRQGVIEHLAQAYTERDAVPLTGREHRSEGNPEGTNQLNIDIAKRYFAAAYYRMLAETCGDPDMSWRSAWVNQWQGSPDFHARFYLLHLNQGVLNREDNLIAKDIVDKDLVWFLFHLRPEFAKPDVYDGSGRRIGALKEWDFLQKILNYTNGWDEDVRQRLIAQCADNPNILMAQALREMREKGLLTNLEIAYLDVPGGENMRRIIAKERALRHYEQWDKATTFDLLYTLATRRQEAAFLFYDRETGEHYTIDPAEIQGRVAQNEYTMGILAKVKGLSEEEQNLLLTAEDLSEIEVPGWSDDEKNWYARVRGNYSQAELESFSRNNGLSEHERQALEDIETGRLKPDDIIDEQDLLEKIRFNRTRINERVEQLKARVQDNISNGRRDINGLTPAEVDLWLNRDRANYRDLYGDDQVRDSLQERIKRLRTRADENTKNRKQETDGFSPAEISLWESRENPDSLILFRDGNVNFFGPETAYWRIWSNQTRLESINRIEIQRMSQEVNEARLRRANGGASPEDNQLLDSLARIDALRSRAEDNRRASRPDTAGFRPRDIELWANRHQLQYWTINTADFTPDDRRNVKEMELLLRWFNWPELRQVYNLDYPWLDLQQRQFFTYALNFAIRNKLGFFGEADVEKTNPKTGRNYQLWEDYYPLEDARIEDYAIAALEAELREKDLLVYRYGNGLEKDREIQGKPIVGRYTGAMGFSDIQGDPVLSWEQGDDSYSFAWLQQARGRWTPPMTLCAYDRWFHFLHFRAVNSPRIVRAMGQGWDRKEIAYRISTPWDLFATRSMEVGVLGGFIKIAQNESGIYDNLMSSGMDHLSPWILHHLLVNEGRFISEEPGAAQKAWEGLVKTIPIVAQIHLFRNRKEPKNFRQLMWEFGIEDLKTGKVGGEEGFGSMFELGLGVIPLEIGKFFPKNFNLFTGPRIRTIQYPTVAGIGIGAAMGVIGGPPGMAFGALGGAIVGGGLGTIAMIGLQIGGFYDQLKDWAIRNLIAWDWPFDPDKVVQSFLEQEGKRMIVPPYK